ncbi:hypothetical protein SUDANB120_03919 [Streptomyces sp. enrichment culture]|uniref:hypothetical protein n=1 Tax=Streptomyces sp. enrichment culture TaxID=1795815 RepID=UPI003F54A560
MSFPDRKEEQVRRLLAGPRPPVPAGLAAAAAARGDRLVRRRRVLRRIGWALLFAAAAAFAVWASLARPWELPPSEVSPPLQGW